MECKKNEVVTVDRDKLAPFQSLDHETLSLILDWRNHPEVRSRMATREPIAWQEHLNYVESLPERLDREYYLVLVGDQPVGVIYLTEIDYDQETANWGYYKDPENSDPTIAFRLIGLLRALFYDRWRGKRLTCYIAKDNEVARRMVEVNGFAKSGEDKQYAYYEDSESPR